MSPRVDAKASKSRTGVGSWSPEVDHTGKIIVWGSRWYKWGWVCEKCDKPALILTTLEALALLVTLEDFYGDVPNSTMTKVVLDGQPGEWRCTQEADDYEVSRVGRLHGVVNLHEEDGAHHHCGMDPGRVPQRGRRSDRRRPLAFHPVPADPDHVGVIKPIICVSQISTPPLRRGT